jgi:hypothetical protein
MGRSKSCSIAFSELYTVCWCVIRPSFLVLNRWVVNGIPVGHESSLRCHRAVYKYQPFFSPLNYPLSFKTFSESTELKSFPVLSCDMWYAWGRMEEWGFYMRSENSSLDAYVKTQLLQWKDAKYFGERNYNADIFRTWEQLCRFETFSDPAL